MSDKFTCKYCGDNLPMRFGIELENEQHVCPSCGLAISIMGSFPKEEGVLLITKHPFWGTETGFSDAMALSPIYDMDKVRKSCPDLKEIPLSREEMISVASCVAKNNEADHLRTKRYDIYKSIAHRIATIMKVKTLSERQVKREIKEYWTEYEKDLARNIGWLGYQGNDEKELLKEEFDYEALKIMINEIG